MAEQHLILNKVPTTMSLGRAAFGVYQGINLFRTPPEDRTLGDAGITAGMLSTDKWDGELADRYGSTRLGAEADLLADILCAVSSELALALRGEISPIHPLLTIGREAIVSALRYKATAEGRQDMGAQGLGPVKTTWKMGTQTVADSPLSQKADILESMASIGDALSLVSGNRYLQQYFAGRKTPNSRSQLPATARNGGFRRASASPNEKIARFIHEKAPRVRPEHLTYTGELLVEVSAITALVKPKYGFLLAAVPYTIGGLIDGVDGNHARLTGLDSLEGMLTDVRADKRQAIVTAVANSLLASNNGNKVASSQYAVAAMTATLPALFRAMAEAKGYIVSEDASGSRVVSGIEGGVGMAFNDKEGISNVVSALLATGNLITAAERADVVMKGSASAHYRGKNDDLQFREYAAARRNALIPIALAGLAIGSGLLLREHSEALNLQQKFQKSKQKASDLTQQVCLKIKHPLGVRGVATNVGEVESHDMTPDDLNQTP